MKRFAHIGVAGYVAPRHLRAIKETGNTLVVALDKNDSVGILDSYFDDVDFFTEFERFERHCEKLRREGKGVDFVSITTPNYLHDAHIRFGLRIGADVICEKPIIINPWNFELLEELEKESGKNIYTVLQLRHHPSIIKLKERIEKEPKDKIFNIDLSYITKRGKWYDYSWKGDITKSGGVTINIGIHFFDMLIWIFGKPKEVKVNLLEDHKAAGYLELERAKVRWFLSIDKEDLSRQGLPTNKPFRSITIDGDELEFSGGFTDLHTVTYQQILAGKGFRIDDAKDSVDLVYQVRTAPIENLGEKAHPLSLDVVSGEKK